MNGVWYEERGAGPAVLFIPGLSGVARGFRFQMNALASHFRVICYDRRGSGQSEPAVGLQSVEAMADEALSLMDDLGLERPHVVGHSTGGAIALSIATRFPERIDRVVVSAGWAHPDPGFAAAFERRKTVLREAGPEAYLRLANKMTFPAAWADRNADALERKLAEDLRDFPPIELVLARIDAICRFDVGPGLSDIRHPTLVMCAEDDEVVPVHLSRWIAARVPAAKAHYFATGGHATPHLAAAWFNAQLLDFLK